MAINNYLLYKRVDSTGTNEYISVILVDNLGALRSAEKELMNRGFVITGILRTEVNTYIYLTEISGREEWTEEDTK